MARIGSMARPRKTVYRENGMRLNKDDVLEIVNLLHRECGPDCCITGDRCEDEDYYSIWLGWVD